MGLPTSGAWATPENMRRIATRAEELGYASLWTFQQLLHPVDDDWGWISSSRADLTWIGESIALVRLAAHKVGRDPDTLRFVGRGVAHVRPEGADDRRPCRERSRRSKATSP